MGATAQVAMVFSVVDRSPAHAGGNGQDDQAVTPLDDGTEPAPDLRALHRKRFHLLVAGVVFVGGGALVELLTGGPVVVAVLDLIVAVCIAVVLIDEVRRRRSPRR